MRIILGRGDAAFSGAASGSGGVAATPLQPGRSVVLMGLWLRLWRRLRRPLLAGVTLSHALAAIHAAIAVPVGAAAPCGALSLVLGMLAALMLSHLVLSHLMLGVRGGLWCDRCGLGSGRQCECKRNRGNEVFHVHSPSDSIEFNSVEIVRKLAEGEGRIRVGAPAPRR